jgi:alpha-L-fucosidase
MSQEQYQTYFDRFNPDLYDPAQWAALARGAGMKYFVITTKHHDGCCLWDSALTDWKVTNTPAGRDLLTPMVEAFRNEGLKVGFYHSLLDWHHPDYPIGRHPQSDDEEFVAANKDRDGDRYVDYLHGQVRELLTQFGKVDIMWFDGGEYEPEFWRSEELCAMIRELQPGILINDRARIPQDITTPEQVQMKEPPRNAEGKLRVWESCQTFSGSWGYFRDQLDWKSPEMIIKMLIDGVSKGGNMLFNVGPNGRGVIEPRAVERLNAVGEWMSLHGRSIYGCGPSEFTPPPDCRYTQNGNRLYLHAFSWPYKTIYCPGLRGKIEYAQLLNDGSEIQQPSQAFFDHHMADDTEDTLVLEIPVQEPPVAVPVIEMVLR